MEHQCFSNSKIPSSVQSASGRYSINPYGFPSMFPNELSCAIITSTTGASNQHSTTVDWTNNLATDSFSIGDNTSCSSAFDSNSAGATWNNNEHFDLSKNHSSKLSLDVSLKKEKKRRSSKSNYKHVPHREKPVHLVARRNARERKRVQAVNSAFVRLRRCVPVENRNKRLSKVKTLHRAIEYIAELQGLLDESDELSPVGSIGVDSEIGHEHALARTVIDQSNAAYASRHFDEGPFYMDGQSMGILYPPSTLMTSRNGASANSKQQNFIFKGSTF